ncbi:MAG: DUF3710 domain-containing protein [Lapillicoccus sp.]
MGLFRRDRKSAADEPVDVATAEVEDLTVADDASGEVSEAVDADRADEPEERYNRTRGPFDAAEVEDDDEVARIDLGSLLVPPVEGMQLRLELDQEQQSVTSAHALLGGSGVQLQVFAAPRTMGVWPDIRSEIADSVRSQGGTADVVDGPLGRELVAAIPSQGADGRPVHTPVRFLGVDGPRWFLRAVISGPAATDESQAEPLVDLVRSVVVVRDDEARPPREALPLRVPTVPEESADAEGTPAGDEAAEGDEDAAAPQRSADDLRPFERGPEITEVR